MFPDMVIAVRDRDGREQKIAQIRLRRAEMIPINVVQGTALKLMDKAAIEIPDDYLSGLKHAAAVEDGDLSSFVLQAMLENYEAAKEDRRAMCGDTGCPRWYVKMANEAQY